MHPNQKQRKELNQCFNQAKRLAYQHRIETTRLNALCEGYYGTSWHDLDAITDNDDIIDTLDYGTSDISFHVFDRLVLKAMGDEQK
ncbi:MAG: hypothetical protein BA864_04745 [Desulfuromonadales bacterium C00003093]|nr:MAG: hypothetical protein BA864_04745 [Desulfuromonadales bacterium C00003093]